MSRNFIASARQVFSTRFSDIRVSLTDAFADEQLSMIRSGVVAAGAAPGGPVRKTPAQPGQAFVRESFQPAIGQEVLTPAEAIAMIADGVGFTFVHDDQYRCPGVVFKRIDGEPLGLESGIVYRPEAASPIVHALIAVLQHRYPVAGESGNRARAGQVA